MIAEITAAGTVADFPPSQTAVAGHGIPF